MRMYLYFSDFFKCNFISNCKDFFSAFSCRHSTKPEFKKNGMRVDQKEIQTLAKKCHIQTNNLCQFLPQDVVREFPEMKPQQVFHNTLKAVGNTEMLEIHEKLSSKQDQKTELDTTVKTKERTLQDLERKFEDKRQIRETIKKKQALKQQINLFRKQRTCLEGENHRIRLPTNLVD